MTTTRVVVGLDGSDGSSRALQWCIDHAGALDAEVVAVHALYLPVMLVPDRAMPSLLVESDAVVQERAEKDLEEWCQPLRDAGTPYRARTAVGAIAKVLDDVAIDEGAELIAVGRRGRGGFAELVLGSVSHQLSHHAHTPLLIIPASEVPA
jgi:nucleotide-binding universal stress UspA family protein